jgi:hypothetical protein
MKYLDIRIAREIALLKSISLNDGEIHDAFFARSSRGVHPRLVVQESMTFVLLVIRGLRVVAEVCV